MLTLSSLCLQFCIPSTSWCPVFFLPISYCFSFLNDSSFLLRIQLLHGIMWKQLFAFLLRTENQQQQMGQVRLTLLKAMGHRFPAPKRFRCILEQTAIQKGIYVLQSQLLHSSESISHCCFSEMSLLLCGNKENWLFSCSCFKCIRPSHN